MPETDQFGEMESKTRKLETTRTVIEDILRLKSGLHIITLYTVDATEYVTAQIDATFHEGREKWRTVS